MALRQTERGGLPPGVIDLDTDDLMVTDEPPGGCWAEAGLEGPGDYCPTATEAALAAMKASAPQMEWQHDEQGEDLPEWACEEEEAGEDQQDDEK